MEVKNSKATSSVAGSLMVAARLSKVELDYHMMFKGCANCSAPAEITCPCSTKLFCSVLRNIRRVAALEAVGNFIFFITKVLISATCALACFVWMGQYYREETHSITYPTLLVAAMAFHLGAIFVGVVDMVADTLLICFIADEEIYGEGDDNCFATPGLRGYIEGHPNHVKTPKAGGDKGDDKL